MLSSILKRVKSKFTTKNILMFLLAMAIFPMACFAVFSALFLAMTWLATKIGLSEGVQFVLMLAIIIITVILVWKFITKVLPAIVRTIHYKLKKAAEEMMK